MRALLLVTLSLALVAGVAAAHAHAFLDHASPTVGSTVRTSLSEVIRFFEGRQDILFLDLNEPAVGERICRFLGLTPIALRHVDFRRGEGLTTHVFEGQVRENKPLTSGPSGGRYDRL
jgi:hypothetical protein